VIEAERCMSGTCNDAQIDEVKLFRLRVERDCERRGPRSDSGDGSIDFQRALTGGNTYHTDKTASRKDRLMNRKLIVF
jgi:hypothetical protein